MNLKQIVLNKAL